MQLQDDTELPTGKIVMLILPNNISSLSYSFQTQIYKDHIHRVLKQKLNFI